MNSMRSNSQSFSDKFLSSLFGRGVGSGPTRDPLKRTLEEIDHSKDVLMDGRPTKYSHQRRGKVFCGGRVAQTILSANPNVKTKNPEEYIPRFRRNPVGGFTFPSEVQRAFEDEGYEAPVLRLGGISPKKRVVVLQRELDAGSPVSLVISPGYVFEETDPAREFSELKTRFASHWTAVLGYNDLAGIFYVYEPRLPSSSVNDLPVGNVVRTNEQLVRDMRPSFLFRSLGNLIIPARKKKASKNKS